MKIANQFAKHAVIDPDARYHESNRAWIGVPSIARTRGGRLLVTFMGGGIYEPDPRNESVMVYSDDNGETWSQPVLVLKSKPEERLRTSDMELWIAPDGSLWGFWSEYPYPDGLSLPTYEQKIDMENDSEYHSLEHLVNTYATVCRNPDADELIFSEPRLLFNSLMRNRPFVTDSGRWIFPAQITSPREYYEFFYSDDEGKTLHPTRCYGRDLCRAYDEACFYRMPDGAVAAVVRTTPPLHKRMISYDNGETWSTPAPFMDTSSQRPCTFDLPDGSVALIRSIHDKQRNGLKLMRSTDGEHFEDVMILDDRERVSYAEITSDEAGTLYIVYDRERNNKVRKSRVTGFSEAAKEILFARIPRAAWESAAVTPDTVRARIITKARINALDNDLTAQKRATD